MPDLTPLGGPAPIAPRPAAAATAPPALRPAVYGPDRLAIAQAADVTGLSEEETKFVRQGWLPANFAAIRAVQREKGLEAAVAFAREGVKGPFTRKYGDPDVMLDGARRWAKNPDWTRMMATLQPGDILVTTWNKTDDVISHATDGPFIHTQIVTSANPPEVIEALGASGDISDPTSNKVLRSMVSQQCWDNQTIRVIRPAAGLSPLEADKAVKRALAYAEGQLGKPYDFAFTDREGAGWNDAFYCSELTYKAYASPKGADLPIALDKAPDRDLALSAVSSILDGLRPDDKGALTFQVAQLAAKKGLKNEDLVAFIAREVLPKTEATRAIANTPARQAALEAAIGKVIRGEAFFATGAALDRFGKREAKGDFKGVGGFFRRLGGFASIAGHAIGDARALTRGVGFWRSIGVILRVGKVVVPHLETLTTFFFGADDPRTRAARGRLDQLDAMARDAHRVPLVGKLWPLPERARPAVNKDFVSPTDLAWSAGWHQDFNVQRGRPIDKGVTPWWRG